VDYRQVPETIFCRATLKLECVCIFTSYQHTRENWSQCMRVDESHKLFITERTSYNKRVASDLTAGFNKELELQ
jgi:hypothetical protein